MMASEASGSIITLAKTPKIGTVLKYTILNAEDAINAAKLIAKLLIKEAPGSYQRHCVAESTGPSGFR